MEWLKGDILSAFSDLPDMRMRASDYIKSCNNRDKWLQDLHDYACSSDLDFSVFSKISDRIGSCSSQIVWGANSSGIPERLVWGNFCENNFCPICARKKSVRLGRVLNCMMEQLDKEGYKFFHLILSDKNCTLDNFSDTLKHYNESWNRFNNSVIRKHYSGYFVSLEYTLRWNGGHAELHPHFHVLLACSPDEWNTGSSFIDHSDLVRLWRRSLAINKLPEKDQYDPRAFIYQVYKGNKKIFLELTKYIFDFGNFSNFIREHPYSVSLAQVYLSLRHKSLHRGGGVLALSSKNLYFVQSTTYPDYTPSYCIITGRSRITTQFNVKYVVKLDDACPLHLGDDVAPLKAFLRTYIKHQAYFFGYGYHDGDKIHLPDWWDDLSVYPSKELIEDVVSFGHDPTQISISFDQISIFDFL